jgi:hypothetical protein
VYDDEYYLSDKWEATEFATEISFEEPFFEQYQKLALAVPHQSLFKDPKSVNSDYVVSGVQAKDCYFTAIPFLSEKIYYSCLPIKSKECINILESENCELSFDCVSVSDCYKCIKCIDISNCMESAFLYDCKNCQNCFMSSNLKNKTYYFDNKQLSKDEYQKKISEINLGDKSVYQKFGKKFNDLIKTAIKKNVLNVKTENCIGNRIHNSENCFYSFNIINSCQNLRYVMSANDTKDSMDVFGSPGNSLTYESSGAGPGSEIKFSITCRDCLNVEYCSECNSCEDCFACFGLKNKKYHIFNKPYSEDEYWQKVDELKTKMLERGEYGEFFPLKDSPFPYQDSNAQVEFPLTEKEIKEKGWHWQGEVESGIDLTKIDSIKGEDLPDDIKDTPDNILKTAIICERTGEPFKVVPYELEFYQKMNLPLPTIHPLERIKDLFKYRRPYKLYNTNCKKCQKEIQTVHNPEKTENIWCGECYNREVG